MIQIELPAEPEQINKLHTGDAVSVSGTVITGRDSVHHYLWHELIHGDPQEEDIEICRKLKELCRRSVIYHSGPIMKEDNEGWKCIAAGPTTSIREEPYQADIIKEFGLAGIIGKGGMGDNTLQALAECGGAYLHAVGGAGAVAAQAITHVREVLKLEFGMPEAIWVLEIKNFPAIVTMDCHGKSLHKDIEEYSNEQFQDVILF